MPNRQPSIAHPVGDAKLFNGINATFFGRLFFREFLGSPERGEVFVVATRSQRMFSVDVYNYRNYFKKLKTVSASLLLLTVLLAGLIAPSGEVQAISYILSVDDPNGGENIFGGSVFDIRLSTSVAGGVLVVTYSTDGGLTFPNEITTNANTGGSQVIPWHVPNNVDTTSARVQVEWRNRTSSPYTVFRTDQSNGNFTITPSAVLEFMDFPSTMSYGRNELIRWNLWDGIGQVGALMMQVRYRPDATWGAWTTPTGIFSNIPAEQGGVWFMTDYYESAHGQIRLRAYTSLPGGTFIKEIVSPEFEISSPWIEMTSLNGGETLVGGSTYEITWATANDASGIITGAYLNYSLNGGSTWLNIIASTANDFSHYWEVPEGINSDHVRIKVGVYHTEFSELAHDVSDTDLRIISNSNVPSVSLITPNPSIPGQLVLFGGETYDITWRYTLAAGTAHTFRLYLSQNNGSTFTPFANLTGSTTSYSWRVPALDIRTAKIKVQLDVTGSIVDDAFSTSSNPFYIFTETVWNRPPVAVAPNSLSALEGALVVLDGSDSYDPDGDALSYHWEQVDSLGFDVELSDPHDDRPTFRANIRDYSVSLVFQLTVSDGGDIEVPHYTDNMKRTSVLITPTGPSITGFTPALGYEGTDVCITGSNMMGGQVRIGGVLTATVPTSPSPANPNPDESFNFTLASGIPLGPRTITVTTAAGTVESEDELDVHPRPWYCLDHGFTFGNIDKDYLSYPWLVWENGDYRRTFGNDVYLCLWICLGLPYWTPWDGWDCLGYLIDEPFCPDPLAALWYGIAYCHLAQGGECFGLSVVNLELALEKLEPEEIQPGVYTVDDLELVGALRERVDFMHGSQVSAECVHYWVAEHLYNLAPSVHGFSGMGLVLSAIENSIDSGDLGVISIVDGGKGHIVVPYEVVDIDADTTRVYIWDINKPEWSREGTAEAALLAADANMNHPPYIEIDKSGMYWEWSYYFSPGQGWWGGTMGLTFVHSDVVTGDRTLPTTLDGLCDLVFGCASGSVEDEEGNVMEMLDNGTYRMEIEGASPFTLHSGNGNGLIGFHLPDGNYTTRIHGFEHGIYNCTVFNGNRTAYAIENAMAENGTEDSLRLFMEQGSPYWGTMTFRTSDEEKVYSAAMIKRFDERERVFRIINASIFEGDRAIISTSHECDRLVFQNDGDHGFTFDVRFQGNVLSEEAWERLNGTLTGLPTCEAFNIEIGPHETLTIYPSDWLDLESSVVVVEREQGEGGLDVMLLVLIIGIAVMAAAVIWYLMYWRRR